MQCLSILTLVLKVLRSFGIHIRVYVYGFRIVVSCCYWGLFSFSHIQLHHSAKCFFFCSSAAWQLWNFLVYNILFCSFANHWTDYGDHFGEHSIKRSHVLAICNGPALSKQIRSIMRHRNSSPNKMKQHRTICVHLDRDKEKKGRGRGRKRDARIQGKRDTVNYLMYKWN